MAWYDSKDVLICDHGSFPAICSFLIIISAQLHVGRMHASSLTLYQTSGALISCCGNTGPISDIPYWTSKENS